MPVNSGDSGHQVVRGGRGAGSAWLRAALVCLFVGVAGLTVGAPALAAPGGTDRGNVVLAANYVLGQAEPSAPAGPDISPAPTAEDAANSRQRLIIGATAVGLLAIVILGRRARAKKRKAS